MTLSDRIEHKIARIAVVGQGYVGLPLAVEFARAGFHVTGLETDPGRVTALTRGESYIPDVPSEVLQDALQAGRFTPTSDPAVLAACWTAILICVPTPLRKTLGSPISPPSSPPPRSRSAAHLRRGQLIVLESTTYPGTTDEVLVSILLAESGLTLDREFFVAFSPGAGRPRGLRPLQLRARSRRLSAG